MLKLFTQHPNDVGETYLEHLQAAWKIGRCSIEIGLIAIIHGALPFMYTHTASDKLIDLAKNCKGRQTKAKKSKRKISKAEYDRALHAIRESARKQDEVLRKKLKTDGG